MKIFALVNLIVTAVANPIAQEPSPSFEVASVKENTSGSSVSSLSGPRPGRFTITNTPLRFIVLEAFGLLDHQLIGGPNWITTASFDISATFPQGSVLADHFKSISNVPVSPVRSTTGLPVRLCSAGVIFSIACVRAVRLCRFTSGRGRRDRRHPSPDARLKVGGGLVAVNRARRV
jgi:hypothetical protein